MYDEEVSMYAYMYVYICMMKKLVCMLKCMYIYV